MTETESLKAAENALYLAMVARDKAGLEAVVSPDAQYVHSNAIVEGRDQYIARVLEGHYAYSSVEPQDVTVRVGGDLGVISGVQKMAVATGGGPLMMMTLLFTLVWVREDGAWKLVHRQATNAGAVEV